MGGGHNRLHSGLTPGSVFRDPSLLCAQESFLVLCSVNTSSRPLETPQGAEDRNPVFYVQSKCPPPPASLILSGNLKDKLPRARNLAPREPP